MEKAVETQLGALGTAIQATAIPPDRKSAIAWAIRQLPALYLLLLETRESRYDDKITRLFQGLLNDLTCGGEACPGARKLAAGLPEALRRLHERLGLPGIALKLPPALSRTPRVRNTTAGKKKTTQAGAGPDVEGA